MSLYDYVVAALNWVSAHPAETVLLAGSVASLFKDKVSAKWPATSKLFALAAHAGFNLAGLRAELVAGVPVVAAAAEKAVVAAEAKQ